MHLELKHDHHMHMPHARESFMWANRVAHNEAFWAWITILALAGTLVALGMWASMTGSGGSVEMPSYYPYYP